jgi:hypothetical protein
MTRHRARSFQLEALEGRQLLTALHPAHHATSNPATLVLSGTLKGLANKLDVSGFSGEIKALGRVHADVSSSTGFNPGSSLLTEIIVTGAKGSITLSFGPDFASDNLTRTTEVFGYAYTVVSGTGAYAGASGTGNLTLTVPTGDGGWGFTSPSAMTTISLHAIRSS